MAATRTLRAAQWLRVICLHRFYAEFWLSAATIFADDLICRSKAKEGLAMHSRFGQTRQEKDLAL